MNVILSQSYGFLGLRFSGFRVVAVYSFGGEEGVDLRQALQG